MFSALAQSLIEAASAPLAEVVSGFADLVLLVNPALEGARYLPIHDIVTSARRRRTVPQLPVFVCVQADNDAPVGTWFPIGNARDRLTEATIGDLERRCVAHAIGFIDEFRTHALHGPAGADAFVLEPPDIRRPDPFWVVRADAAVIDGHGGIWTEPFGRFLAALLFQHVAVSRDAPAAGLRARIAGAGTLAAYARGLGV